MKFGRSKEQKPPLDPVTVYNAIDRRRYDIRLLPETIKTLDELPGPVKEFVEAAVAVHQHHSTAQAAMQKLDVATRGLEDALELLAAGKIPQYGKQVGAPNDEAS